MLTAHTGTPRLSTLDMDTLVSKFSLLVNRSTHFSRNKLPVCLLGILHVTGFAIRYHECIIGTQSRRTILTPSPNRYKPGVGKVNTISRTNKGDGFIGRHLGIEYC